MTHKTQIFLQKKFLVEFDAEDKAASTKIARRYIRKTLLTSIKDASSVEHNDHLSTIRFTELEVEIEEGKAPQTPDHEDPEVIIPDITLLIIAEAESGVPELLTESHTHSELLEAASSFGGKKWFTKTKLAKIIIKGIQNGHEEGEEEEEERETHH